MGHMSTRVRLDPATRREQLLDLGVKLLATRSFEDMSIDVLAEEAGISRGLLYHYFGNKQDFHLAVVRRLAEALYEATAPVDDPSVVGRLGISLQNYLDFVVGNHRAYVAFRHAALGGNEDMRGIYEVSRTQLLDRLFDAAEPEELAAFGITDTPASRMLSRGWASMVEDVILNWLEDDRGIARDDLLASLTLSLAGVLAVAPTSG